MGQVKNKLRPLVILKIIVVFVIITIVVSISPADKKPYFKSDYYQKSLTGIDSLKSILKPVKGPVKAGFSRISITPVLGAPADDPANGEFRQMPLAGFGWRKGKPATGIHDSIFVKAAAIQVQEQLIILVSADLLLMPPYLTEPVMREISSHGIRRDQVFFSATHTHSSLGAWGRGLLGKQIAGKRNADLEEWLSRQISDAIMQAIADLKPARIATGEFDAEKYLRNKILGDRGLKNSAFSLICLDQKDGRMALIGSFSAHSTSMGRRNMEISGDYPGYWQRNMENQGFDVALFMAGSMGNQTHNGKGKGFDSPKYLGDSLAEKTLQYLPQLIFEDTLEFLAATAPLYLPDYHLRITNRLDLSTAWSELLLPLPETSFIQAVKLGKMMWITTPGDFGGEFAVELKNSLYVQGYRANITSFNGSYAGYLIPGRYYYNGDAESRNMIFYGPYIGEYTVDMLHQLTQTLTGNPNPDPD